MTPEQKVLNAMTSPEAKKFLDDLIDDFTKFIAETLPTPRERVLWTGFFQTRFQNVFGDMTKILGLEKTKKIVNKYMEIEEKMDKFSDEMVAKSKER